MRTKKKSYYIKLNTKQNISIQLKNNENETKHKGKNVPKHSTKPRLTTNTLSCKHKKLKGES